MAAGDASAPSIADRAATKGRRSPAIAHFRAALRAARGACSRRERDQLPLWLPVGLMLGIAAWFWLPDRRPGSPSCCLPARWPRLARARRRGRAGAGRWRSSASPRSLGCGLIWWKAERAAAPRLERAADGRVRRRGSRASRRCPPRRPCAWSSRPLDAGLPPRLRVNVDATRRSAASRRARRSACAPG